MESGVVLFDWGKIVPTVIGGLISVATTAVMFRVTQRAEREKRQAEKRKAEAVAAFTGFWKLKSIADGLVSIDSQLDEAYARAEEEGLGGAEPAAKVRGLVGAKHDFDLLDVDELLFLNRIKKTELMNDVDLLVRRARNIEVVADKFNELKADFLRFIEAHVDQVNPLQGTAAGFEFTGKFGHLANLRDGTMNNLLWQLHEHLAKDIPMAKRVTEEYLAAARSHFGSDFPEFKFAWMGPNNANP